MFPGATADRDAANYAVIGAPLDVTGSFQPGARFGPERIRQFARGFEDFDQHSATSFTELAVHDHGDVRAWPDVAEYLEFLEGILVDYHEEGVIPLLLGGEHTVTVAAARALEPDTVVCFDAHLDLRGSYDGEHFSHATAMRRTMEVANKLVILGARSGSEIGYRRAGADDVTLVPPSEVPSWHPADAGLDDPDRSVYLSVDIDAADPAYAPGTGTPEPGGLSSGVCRQIVRDIAPTAIGFDVVEVTDGDDGQAATLGAKLLRDFVYEHADTR